MRHVIVMLSIVGLCCLPTVGQVNLPEGFEVVEIVRSDVQMNFPHINTCGQIVFQWGRPRDVDVFLYDNGSLVHITDDDRFNGSPDINDAGTIVYGRGRKDGEPGGEIFIYRDIRPKDLPKIITESMSLVGAILIVLGCALGLTNYMIDAEIPEHLFALLQVYVSSKVVFLIVLNFLLLIINMIEIFSAIVIVVPIIIPIAAQYGIDPIHLGIIFLLNLEIGYMTPPLGLNLFLANRRFGKPLFTLYKATFVFWIIHVVMLILVTYIPSLSLWLLHATGK